MAETTIEADIDSEMTATDVSGNFGDLDLILLGLNYVGGDKQNLWRSIGNFDVSPLAGHAINDAKLVRTIYEVVGTPPWTARVLRCSRPADWVELEVTWDEYSAGNAWTSRGGDMDSSTPPPIGFTEAEGPGDHEILGMGGFVHDALEFRNGIVSVILRVDDESFDQTRQTSWWSKDRGSDVWRLVIDHTPPCPGHRRTDRSPLASGTPAARPTRPSQAIRPSASARPTRPHKPERRSPQ
jgi:hypothetical protein